MKFLIDANLPADAANWIAARGHEAAFVHDVLPESSLDQKIWRYARSNGLVILTKDSDLADLTSRFGGPQVVWIRSGNKKFGLFKAWLEERFDVMFELVAQGQLIIELR